MALPSRPDDGRAWLTSLIPERIDPSLHAPDDATVPYARLEWRPTSADVERTARCVWQRSLGDETERLLAGEATDVDGLVARLEIALRHGGRGVDEGDGALPQPPRAAASVLDRRVVVRPEEVQAFIAELGVSLPANTSPTAAWARGLAGPMLPGTILMATAVPADLGAPSGEIEAWFRAPIPVGALVERRAAPSGDQVQLWLPGRTSWAVLLRISLTT